MLASTKYDKMYFAEILYRLIVHRGEKVRFNPQLFIFY